jgi:hypothetical protein
MHAPQPFCHPRRARHLSATLAAALVALVGCGGSGTTTTTAPTTAPATTGPAPLLDPAAQGPTAPSGQPVNDISCASEESFATHIHPGLAIVLDGQRVTIPTDIGILQDKQCLYWLHTHDGKGVIHIESPSATRVFTLGDFFTVWGYPIGLNKLLNVTGPISAWVNGKPFSADPATIPLRDHETIVLSNTRLATDALPTVDFAEVG